MSVVTRRRRRTETERALLTLFGDVAEVDLQRQVVADLRRLGYAPYHTANSRKSAAGYPDLTAPLTMQAPRWRKPFVLVLELKTEAGRLDTAQLWWAAHFTAIEVETGGVLMYREVRPSTWGRILAEIVGEG
jgi:non-ribosomal peptide synthetase component F